MYAFMLAGDEEGDPELSRLEAGLEIDPRDTTGAAITQPALYYRAALRAARLEAVAAAAEVEARAARARVLCYLCAQAEERAQPPAGAVLEARADQHAEVDAARRRATEARRLGLQAAALRDAYRQRAEILAVLCGGAGLPTRSK